MGRLSDPGIFSAFPLHHYFFNFFPMFSNNPSPFFQVVLYFALSGNLPFSNPGGPDLGLLHVTEKLRKKKKTGIKSMKNQLKDCKHLNESPSLRVVFFPFSPSLFVIGCGQASSRLALLRT